MKIAPRHSIVLIVSAGVLAGCASTAATIAGRIDAGDVREASGLARSRVDPDRLWVINDGGSPPVLYAIGPDGRSLGTLALDGAENVDWEDLASFELDGQAWLLIADVGDNDAERRHVTLYLVREPERVEAGASAAPAAVTGFRFPGGPRDVESVAVDPVERQVYLLSKRTIPPELYALPLLLEPVDRILTAEHLGQVRSLPEPSAADLHRAKRVQSWHWQPTAMDIAPDGARAVILTYGAIYLYERRAGDSWPDALNRMPAPVALGGIREAEAACIVGDSIFVTVESPRAPLYRVRWANAGETR